MKNTSEIPTLDLGHFLSGDQETKHKFTRELGEAYERIGFVALKNHFLEEQTADRLYQLVDRFFKMPLDMKSKYEIDGIGGQRGFTSFGKEHAKGRQVGDLKEFWHFGQQIAPGSKYSGNYPGNVVVRELPEFNGTGVAAYKMLEKTGIYLLRALALHIGLKETYFDEYVREGNSILRAIHYPPITEDPGDAIRAAEHTDINLITLLMGARGDGLQVRNRAGDWIPVKAKGNELIINVGDMLSRHTNDRLVSTVHRVVNPPREEWHTTRYSIPFFMHPVSDMKLDCLESCIDADHPIKYANITAGEFLEQRLAEIGLK